MGPSGAGMEGVTAGPSHSLQAGIWRLIFAF